MGKFSRDKGKRGELEARDLFRNHWNAPDCERAGQISGVYSQDLLRAFPGWHLEIKRIRKIGAIRYTEQALKDSGGSAKHLVLMREDRGSWYLMIPFLSAKAFAEDLITQLGGTFQWPKNQK